MAIYIGVDPGISGAIAVLDDKLELIRMEDVPILKFDKAPKTKRRINKKTGLSEKYTSHGVRREIDFEKLFELAQSITEDYGYPSEVHQCAIERVSAMPRDSTVGAFAFGGAYGALRQVFACCRVPVELVSSKVWQAAMLTSPPKNDRLALRALYVRTAAHLYPGHGFKISKPDRAAAVLIARWLAQQSNRF